MAMSMSREPEISAGTLIQAGSDKFCQMYLIQKNPMPTLSKNAL
jgi:hypothetical protein